jgi:hypothetical protein
MVGLPMSLRRAQHVVIGLLVAWIAVHTVIIWQTGWSAWRLGGLGMYTESGVPYRAASIVACAEPGCEQERRDVQKFAPLKNASIPLLRSTPNDKTPYELVDVESAHGRLLNALGHFERFPGTRNARALLRARLAHPCGPYLVAWYKQHVSMISRTASVAARSYVVTVPTTRGCVTRGE